MQRVPDVTFKTRVRNDAIEGPNPFEWKDLTTDEIFKGKRVVVFSLPGAFTPTCSTSHLPRFEELHEEFRAEGIDQIVCISVNDAFVMYQWGLSQKAKNVFLLPDGTGEFSRKMGMLVDKFGPKILFSSILILGGLISIIFSWMQTYEQLALMRFLSGFIGAGFVVGIRMISEWFPAKQTGVAQGIYGGWGNFGSAGAAVSLPFIAASFGDVDGWRYAITIASILAIAYGVFYYFNVTNTPKGSTYFKPKKSGAMEVSNKWDLQIGRAHV